MRRLDDHKMILGFALVCLLGLTSIWTVGCGGYAAKTREFREAVYRNDFATAQAQIDELVLEAADEGSALETEYSLLLLERSTVSLALGDYEATNRDLNEADGLLEILDLSSDNAETVGRYLWSDDVGSYRAPAYEKLMVNLVKVASYLSLGNYQGARVEARRLDVLASYYDSTELSNHPVLATAYFFAGLAMELGGEPDAALNFYFDAWRREPPPSLGEPLARSMVALAQSSRLARRSEVGEAREALGLDPESEVDVADQEVVLLLFSGLAPRREAQRLPIGLIWGWVTGGGLKLAGDYQNEFDRLQAEQLLTWVNFPVLVEQPEAFTQFDATLDGVNVRANQLADMRAFAVAQWEEERPTVALAAITRAIVRVLAREAVQAVGDAATNSEGANTAVFIASLIVQGGMQAADTPDTRTWSTMAGRVFAARLPAEPGVHTLQLRSSGPAGTRVDELTVEVGAGERVVVGLRIVP